MEIEIMGHKGNIYDIKALQRGFIYPRQDTLQVFLSFNESGKPAFGFCVNLPARPWSKEDFLKLVKDGAEDEVAEMLEHSKEEIEEQQRQWQERQRKLDALADEIKSKVGLLP